MKIEWNKVTWYSKAAAVVVFFLVFALGFYLGVQYNEVMHEAELSSDTMSAGAWKSHIKNTSVATTTKTTTIVPAGEKRFSAYLTGYTYWDNTPPGSSLISNPVVHKAAGGTGTFSDPITVAVGHSFATGKDVLDYPAGTKFYLPYLRKYFIVEDTCGDGAHPENGPCHTGYQGHPWLDLWLDGANGTRATTDACAANVTETHLVIQNPVSTYAVNAGSVYNGSCAQQFGDVVVTAI
jgi:hypothetical protein